MGASSLFQSATIQNSGSSPPRPRSRRTIHSVFGVYRENLFSKYKALRLLHIGFPNCAVRESFRARLEDVNDLTDFVAELVEGVVVALIPRGQQRSFRGAGGTALEFRMLIRGDIFGQPTPAVTVAQQEDGVNCWQRFNSCRQML